MIKTNVKWDVLQFADKVLSFREQNYDECDWNELIKETFELYFEGEDIYEVAYSQWTETILRKLQKQESAKNAQYFSKKKHRHKQQGLFKDFAHGIQDAVYRKGKRIPTDELTVLEYLHELKEQNNIKNDWAGQQLKIYEEAQNEATRSDQELKDLEELVKRIEAMGFNPETMTLAQAYLTEPR